MRAALLILTVFFMSPFSLRGETQKRAVSVDDLNALSRVGQPLVSPDGRFAAFTVSRYCEKKKRRVGDIHVVDLASGKSRRMTTHPGVESGITWSPDAKAIAFSARREGKTSQIYVLPLDGGEARCLTRLDSGASNPAWSPDGRWLAFHSAIGELYPEAMRKELGDVRYLTHLRYTHSRRWDNGKRRRIFVVPLDGSAEPRQLTRGACSDEGDFDFAWSPDSREIAFVSNRDPEWWNSIDTNIYVVSLADGKTRQVTQNPGPDHDPAWSPDGRHLAWRSIFTYNYESENYKLVAADPRGKARRVLTGSLDRSVSSLRWSPRGKSIRFLFGNEGAHCLAEVPATGGRLRRILTGRHVVYGWDQTPDGRALVLLRGDDTHAMELHLLQRGRLRQLTHVNDQAMAARIVRPAEAFWFKASDGARIQGWIVKPVGFKPGEKYPMILSIHGGPHGMSTLNYRFSFQLWAANGYVVVYTNPRASLGYGEAFSRAIWRDWGGQVYRDIMGAVDHVVKMGFVDEKRLGVTGGSFGGYMTNWIVGHTDRFSAAVTVAGLSNLVSFYGTTDEQFFPEAEFKGPPWKEKQVYIEQSPLWYAKNFKTPTMIIHGQYDFRVRTEQAEQMFTALQKQGVPSVYVWFPDEGHGVREPVHRRLYERLLLDWFDRYLKGKPSHFRELMQKKSDTSRP